MRVRLRRSRVQPPGPTESANSTYPPCSLSSASTKFPQSPQRMTPGTAGLYEAVVNSTVTHSGDPRLARHVANARVRTDNRGIRIYKEQQHSTRRIDLAVCAIMAHSVAATVDPGLQLYW